MKATKRTIADMKDDRFALHVLRAKQADTNKPTGLWIGHSRFQCPSFVLEYAGRPPARLTLDLYDRAQGHSYSSADEFTLSFKVRLATVQEKTGMTAEQVKRSAMVLERDGRIYRKQVKSGKTGKFLSNLVTPLNPRTGRAWSTSPGKPGLLSENHFSEYITVPQDTIPAVKRISRHGLAVLLAALEAISKADTGTESTEITRQELRKSSCLGRDAFRKGLKECLSQGFLSFKSKVLTVHDPQTRKPTERWKNRRAESYHQSKKFDFDLNDRTADDYRTLLGAVFNQNYTDMPDRRWHPVLFDGGCPLCGEVRRRGDFAVCINPNVAGFHCYLCGRKGKLVELAAQVLGFSTPDAIEYFRLLLNPPVQEEVAVAV
jgi:hypothetical protein